MSNPRPGTMIGGEENTLPQRPLEILCVEDNSLDFALVREHLKDADFPAGVHLHRAATLAEARHLYEAGGESAACDILLLDLSLPDSQGEQTYFNVCAFAPQAAVVILSGNDDRELAIRLVHGGAQDYLPKDALTPDLLWRSITYAIKRQQQRVELENLTVRLQHTTEDLKIAQAHLIQAEKIESLGRLASSVAHEVKNPLGIVRLGIEVLETNLTQLDGDIGPTLTLMKEAVARAECVIGDMLDFSHQEVPNLIAFPLNGIVERVARMLKYECNRHGIRLDVDLATPSPIAECDRNGIEQVVINLVTNALQAMKKGGAVTVRTRRTLFADLVCDVGLGEMSFLRPSDEVAVIEVQDQGPGIPKDLMERVFEPFFTTKPIGEGTGLGLPICKNVVELHQGQLLVSNIDEPRGLLVSVALKAEPLGLHLETNGNGRGELPASVHPNA